MDQQINLLTFAIDFKLALRDSTLAYVISLQQSALFGHFQQCNWETEHVCHHGNRS